MTDKEKKHQWYLANKEEVKARAKQWAIDNPEKAKESARRRSKTYEQKNNRHRDPVRAARTVEWHKANPERISQIMRKHNYGITPEEYDAKIEKQNNLCALCDKPETHVDRRANKVRALSVDHDHLTDEVRDLLCGNCNRGLGLFFDSPELLSKAIEYLKKHGK